MGEDHTYRYINASGIAGGVDVLWTNPKWNTTDGFSAQKVALNLTNYGGVIILFASTWFYPGPINKTNYAKNTSDGISTYANIRYSLNYLYKGWTNLYIPTSYYKYGSGVKAETRCISVDNTGITFGPGYLTDVNGSTGAENDRAKPIKIWGVKGTGSDIFA